MSLDLAIGAFAETMMFAEHGLSVPTRVATILTILLLFAIGAARRRDQSGDGT